ncbi:MAG: DNA polymerase III subunit beta [Prevotella sp.]|jgi:DNA polymerase-3 subunit beta|nr:DNA polymerase III subunit beta [Prevotella sp.]
MKFTLSSGALNSRLQSLAKVINSKNSLPILDSFLFEVANNSLKITASDSENIMQTTIALDQCEGDGVFAVPSRTILDAVKELSEQPLTFDIDVNALTIKILYQNGIYNFTAQNADEYPRTTAVPDGATLLTIDSSTLADNISRSLFATAQDELRPVMNGIYFDLSADCLAIVASDGHKLVRNQNFSINSDTPASFILPKKPATLLKNTLSKDGGDVIIKFDDRTAEINFSDTVLTCRLIEGKYPNYNSVIPQNNPNKMVIDRKALISALRRVLPFSSESSQLVRLSLTAGKLELSAEDIDFATSAKEQIVCDYTGNAMSIGFKGGSLQEIINNIDSNEIEMQLADPSRAGIVVPAEQPENENVLMLLMPMLLND